MEPLGGPLGDTPPHIQGVPQCGAQVVHTRADSRTVGGGLTPARTQLLWAAHTHRQSEKHMKQDIVNVGFFVSINFRYILRLVTL